MIKKTFIGVMMLATMLVGCTYNCDANKGAHCSDTVPNEACQAAFQRWFYNSATNQCEQKSYSGCAAYGFATQTECEDCKCH